MWVRIPFLPLIRLDGETEIISRFYREGPGSIPGRAIWLGDRYLAIRVLGKPSFRTYSLTTYSLPPVLTVSVV